MTPAHSLSHRSLERAALVGCLATLLALGCGSDDGDGGGGGGATAGVGGGSTGAGFDAGTAPDRNMVSPGGICERLATIQCAGEQHCCPSPGRSFDACKSSLMSACTSEFAFDEIAANPVTGFNPAGAAAAFSELENRAERCDPTVAQWAVSGAGFLTAFDGTVPEGGACTPPGNSTIGMLFSRGDPEQIAALASCQNSATTVCLPAVGVWTCTARAGEGGSCVFDGNCQDNFYCADSGFLSDACTQRNPTGTACTAANECQTFICKGGSCADATAANACCLQDLD